MYPPRRNRRIKRVLASTAALTLLMHDFAWAICSDGSSLPAAGFVVGVAPIQSAANWSPHVFTGTTGSLWVPDTSVNEHNDPTQPLTGGGHNWVFDQGSTLCKVTDVGPPGQVATSWEIPPNNPTDCVILPVITNGQIVNLGDIPFQGDVITPTCDPTLLAVPKLNAKGNPNGKFTANPNNTYFNQLGCSISHGVATTPATATSFLFVAGIKGGMFSVPLNNVGTAVPGGSAGKTVGPQNYYSQIPENTLLTNAAVSKDGQFAVVTSLRNDIRVWGCLNPLGDPGDPAKGIDPNFVPPSGSAVSCMQVGFNGLQADLTTAFGPDNQPYFGGQRVVNSFNSVPGGNFSTAWPNCLWQTVGAASVADAFSNGLVDGCGDAQPNFGFISALITQPPAIISHGNYMYVGPLGGNVIQFAVTQDQNGQSNYQFRTYVTGLSILTGLGVAEDLKSLMIYTDPTTLGLASQEVVTRLPLCEDMLGETTVAGGGTTTTGGGTTTTGGGTTTTGGTGTTTTPTGGFTTPTTAAADNSAPITGAIVGGGVAPTSTGTPATGGAIGGLATPATAGTGVGTPSSAAKGGSTAGAAGNPAAAANPPGVPVAGTAGLFATAGQDPTGPMTAKVTAISLFGLPRIALDPPPFASPTFVASRPNVPTVLDASARAAPGETVAAKVKTKPRTSDVRRNRIQDHLSMTIGNAK
jgi:hypothetical protein